MPLRIFGSVRMVFVPITLKVSVVAIDVDVYAGMKFTDKRARLIFKQIRNLLIFQRKQRIVLKPRLPNINQWFSLIKNKHILRRLYGS